MEFDAFEPTDTAWLKDLSIVKSGANDMVLLSHVLDGSEPDTGFEDAESGSLTFACGPIER
jgi:hypothetical protein